MSVPQDTLTQSRQGPLVRLINWLGGHELTVLLSILATTLGIWLFGVVAAAVVCGGAQSFDESVLRTLRTSTDPLQPVGPAWLQQVARDVTALGGSTVLVIVTVSVVAFLRLDRKFHAMWFVLAAVLGGYALMALLKTGFARPRPNVVPHLVSVGSGSFPSGHSMMSAVVYLTLGVLLSTLVSKRRLKFFFIFVAICLAFLIGCSRVYLGVHYPTDVLAGWSLGLAWAALCCLVARKLQRRGVIEREL